MKQSELKDILDQHRLWLESGQKQGKRANLRGANLRDANLRDANLDGANLVGANLDGANLVGANLLDANLRDANLVGANLLDANLRDANLRDANLRDAYLQGAKFTTNFKKVGWFDRATFSEDQIPWACLHPKFGRWESTLKWVRLLPTQRDIS